MRIAQAYVSVRKILLICWHTLTNARGTLGIGCVRLKTRSHTAKQNFILNMLKSLLRIRTYGLYAKRTARYTLNT